MTCNDRSKLKLYMKMTVKSVYNNHIQGEPKIFYFNKIMSIRVQNSRSYYDCAKYFRRTPYRYSIRLICMSPCNVSYCTILIYHFSSSHMKFFIAKNGIREGEPFGKVKVRGRLKILKNITTKNSTLLKNE